MDDIVELLRKRAREWVPRDTEPSATGLVLGREYSQAADEIERLRAELERARRNPEPFSETTCMPTSSVMILDPEKE